MIGVQARLAVHLRPAGEVAIVLMNPTVIDSSGDCFDVYEGCLSCFDVRGLVPRPKVIEVEHIGLDGAPRITVFRGQVSGRSPLGDTERAFEHIGFHPWWRSIANSSASSSESDR